MKKEFTGWIAKDHPDPIYEDNRYPDEPELKMRGIYLKRGNDNDWFADQLPPSRVRITIEILDDD